jgi:hypothetical protein
MTADGEVERAGFRLPRIHNVTLRNFSLFDHAPLISADFGSGVFCLAGANGLGKSTFLAAVNFGITGIVAEKDRKFESPPEYYDYSKQYSGSYFRGRISNKDRALAEVELEMEINHRRYRLVRNMFEPARLKMLSITTPDGFDVISQSLASTALDEAELHDVYTSNVTSDTGLDDFSQLVFLQHFVLTFDERRHLLFWDEEVMQSAMFIAFGLDPGRAKRADAFRRAAEKADSLAKNLQWQATEARKRAEEVEAAAAGAVDAADAEDARQEHERLNTQLESAEALAQRLDASRRDAELQLAAQTGQRDAIRAEFERVFRRAMSGRMPAGSHPVVAESLTHGRCAVCGTEGDSIRATISSRLNASRCPLCDSDLGQPTDLNEGQQAMLQALDAQLVDRSRAIDEATAGLSIIAGEASEALQHVTSLRNHIAQFERANQEALLSSTASSGALQQLAQQYRGQVAEFLARKDVELTKRERARDQLRQLQDDLARAYAQAEDQFVPRFTTLARAFLGLDLDIQLDTSGKAVQLVLKVKDSTRRDEDTLSESQRFFIDIALRMALVEQIVGPTQAGVLYIDTPEGSLDIAYEARAGRMFGLFVERGNQLVMTANINTSQLLKKLAATCGTEKMKLLRMTEWTSLSDVQSEAEDMFDDAYRAIEHALEHGE